MGYTAALMGLNLPISTKVGLTILKKLYLQAGGGRQENAFSEDFQPMNNHIFTHFWNILSKMKLQSRLKDQIQTKYGNL